MKSADIYRQLTPTARTAHQLGQLFWIPAFLSMQEYYVLRIRSWDRLQPITDARFTIEKKSLGSLADSLDLFHNMPIPELKVATDEELVIKKVKRRPAVLVVKEGFDTRKFGLSTAGLLKRPDVTRHVFAPVFSLRKSDNISKDYPEEFITDVKNGDYPEFIYLPPEGSVIKVESMAVLTELQVHSRIFIEETNICVEPTYFGCNLDEFWTDLQGQLPNFPPA